jgi:hypothetical protein
MNQKCTLIGLLKVKMWFRIIGTRGKSVKRFHRLTDTGTYYFAFLYVEYSCESFMGDHEVWICKFFRYESTYELMGNLLVEWWGLISSSMFYCITPTLHKRKWGKNLMPARYHCAATSLFTF